MKSSASPHAAHKLVAAVLTVILALPANAPLTLSAQPAQPVITQLRVNAGDPGRSIVTNVSFTLSSNLVLAPFPLQIQHLSGGTNIPVNLLSVTLVAVSNILNVSFPRLPGGSLPDGNFLASVIAFAPTNGPIQGSTTNVTSQFLSESFPLHRYFGDRDGDRDVDFLDTWFFRETWNQTTNDVRFDASFDSDADGRITPSDLAAFDQNYFTVLAPQPGIFAHLIHNHGSGIVSNLAVAGNVFRTNVAARLELAIQPGPPNLAGGFTDISADVDSGGRFVLSSNKLAQVRGGPLADGGYELQFRLIETNDLVSARFNLPFALGTATECAFPSLAGWTVSVSTNLADTLTIPGTVTADNCEAVLTEGDSFRVALGRTFQVPESNSVLSFTYAGLSFDTASQNSVKDAFEVAFVDGSGNSLVHTIPPGTPGRDVFFNVTEGEPIALGRDVQATANTVTLNLASSYPGTQATLIFRLINNDGDNKTTVRISNVTIGPAGPVPPGGIAAISPLLLSPPPVDFALLSDVTDAMTPSYGRTSFRNVGTRLFTDLTIRNSGTFPIDGPLVAVVAHLSDPSVRVLDADGHTPAGLPYFNFASLITGRTLSSGQTTSARTLAFLNPSGGQFTFDLVILGQLNRSPIFTTDPVVEALVDRPYTYTAAATDPDRDSLAFSLLAAPAAMINSQLSITNSQLQWTPRTNDLGGHDIKVQVEDGRGGSTEQRYVLNVISPPPNRPPNFTSTPGLEARLNTRYNYGAKALDPDGDSLTFSLSHFPTNMTVNPTNGLITWTPSVSQLGTNDVSALVSDGRGGIAAQSYVVTVLPDPANHPPIIISQPVTNAIIGQTYAYYVKAIDPDADAVSFSLVNPLSGMSIVSSNGIISWLPSTNDLGSRIVAVRASDGRGGFGEQSFTLEVAQPADLMIANVDPSAVLFDGQALTASGTARAGITNLGPGSVNGPFEVLFFEDRNLNGAFDPALDSILGSTTVTNVLQANEGFIVSSPVAGSVVFPNNIIWAFVDSANVIFEGDEANNVASSQYECIFRPPVGQFDPMIKWKKDTFEILPAYNQVMMTPAVIDLNEDGIPDIIFSTFRDAEYSSPTGAVLRAISGLDGHDLWTATNIEQRIMGSAGIAVGDIDLDGHPEIIAVHDVHTLFAFEHDGTFKWRSQSIAGVIGWGSASIADLNHDGQPEIIIGGAALRNDGTVLWQGTNGLGNNHYGLLSIVADLDLDGTPEIVAGQTAYRADGTVYWQAPIPDGFAAVGNFDGDPYPEVVVVGEDTARGNYDGFVTMLEHDGRKKWGSIALPGRGYGGPPTVADMDGDGIPEIGIAGAAFYVVLNANGTVKWQRATRDGSSTTGSSVFDFEGDGKAEVLYNDELTLRIYRGTDGAVLYELPKGSGTAFEYPLVADVDADGKAEIVAVANNYAFGAENGIYIIGDRNDTWVSTRRIWNQHSYHINNVNDDGTIPRYETNSWQTHNTYRLNLQTLPGGPLAAPDLVACYLRVSTTGEVSAITARIGNAGALQAPSGINVAFYGGNPASGTIQLGIVKTTKSIVPGAFEDVSLLLTNRAVSDIWVAADDDGTGKGQVNECNETNNLFSPTTGAPQLAEIHGKIFHDVDGDSTSFKGRMLALSFDSLPSAQGWMYVAQGVHSGILETNVFSIDGTNLTQNSMGKGVGDSGGVQYIFTNILRPDLPFNLLVRARVLREEGNPGYNSAGFGCYVHGGTNFHAFWLSPPAEIHGACCSPPIGFEVLSTAFDTTQFHDYLIQAIPGTGDLFFVDGTPVSTNGTLESRAIGSSLAIGDGTAGANAEAQIQRYVFTQYFPDTPDPALEGFIVFLDDNKNGRRDPDERFVLSDPFGNYSFSDLPPGNYVVRQEVRSGWKLTSPLNGFYQLTLRSGQVVSGIDFGNQVEPTAFGLIQGRVFHDRDGDGTSFAGKTISLKFDSLPSAQGWTYDASDFHAGVKETNVFSVDGTNLIQNSMGNGVGRSGRIQYVLTDVVRTNLPFSLSVRAGVLREEGNPGYNSAGFECNVYGGTNFHRFLLSPPAEIQGTKFLEPNVGLEVLSTEFDTTQFHDYLIRAVPGVGDLFFADGVLVSANGTLETRTTPFGNSLAFGDGTAGANAEAQIQRYVFTQFDPGSADPALAGFIVYLDANSNGQRDSDELFATTDSLGNYTLNGIPPKSYLVRQESGSGWAVSNPETGSYNVTVVPGEPVTGINFGNRQITGVNFNPEFVSVPPINTSVGALLRYQASAIDANGDAITFDLSLAPSGMATSANGILVWRPRLDQAGTHDVILRVRDDKGGVDLQAFQITVTHNSAPRITSVPFGPAVAGLLYRYQVTAQDPDNDLLAFGLLAFPSNMVINAGNGLLTWTPATADVGSRFVRIRAVDSKGAEDTQSFTLPVVATAQNRPPEITSLPRSSIGLGDLYVYEIKAADPDNDPLTFSLPTAPDGMILTNAQPSTLNSQLLVWTATGAQLGTNGVTLRVEDGRGGFGSQEFLINVVQQSTNRPPTITSKPTFFVNVTNLYQYDPIATDPDNDPVLWNLNSGPTGLSLDSASGKVRWTPTTEQRGVHEVVIAAMDTHGASGIQGFRITVGENAPPLILSSPPTTAFVGEPYLYPVRATDSNGDPITFALALKPDRMTINETNGLIEWTPATNQISLHEVQVEAGDGHGGATRQTFSVLVTTNAPNQLPVISSSPPFVATVGALYEYPIIAKDPEGFPLTFRFHENPPGMTINIKNGLVQWTPTRDQLGAHSVRILAMDVAGDAARQSYSLTVRETNRPPVLNNRPSTIALVGLPYTYAMNATDPDNDPLTYTLVEGPPELAFDALGRVIWLPTLANVGTNKVALRVQDSRGAFFTYRYDLNVIADTTPPQVVLNASPKPARLGEPVTFLVDAVDNIAVATKALTIGGLPIALDGAGRGTMAFTTAGFHEALATVTDTAGNFGTNGLTLQVIDPTKTNSPKVFFTELRMRMPPGSTNPYVSIPLQGPNATNLVVVTSFSDMFGTVQDDDLDYWTVSVAPFDSGNFREIARGSNTLVNANLGMFDPSLLQNDTYRLRLAAVDRSGNSVSTEVEVNVSGGLKLGNFRLSFLDLTLPIIGVPIQIGRTYDSLEANTVGDFGYGWRLDLFDVNLRANTGTTGLEDVGIFEPYHDGTRIFIRLPDGRREGFTVRAKLGSSIASGLLFTLARFATIEFVPDRGVYSRLALSRDFTLKLTVDGQFINPDGIPFNPASDLFQPVTFVLTSKEGTRFEIDTGSGTLRSIVGVNNDQLTVTRDGIFSSAGHNVRFSRDSQGRITAVSIPDNLDTNGIFVAPVTIHYGYDFVGDLYW